MSPILSPSHKQVVRLFVFAATLTVLLSGSACRNSKEKQSSNGKQNQSSGEEDRSPPFAFVERTENSGISGTYHTGIESGLCTMLETLGGGVGVADYDLDGEIDCFFNGGGGFTDERAIVGKTPYLFRNLSSWKFSNTTAITGLDQPLFYDHGCQFGDLDNDGFQDLIVTGYRKIVVFRNLGDGSFEPIECGIETESWATSAALADFDGDGNLDLFVCNYLEWSFENHQTCSAPNDKRDVCSPRFWEGKPDDLYTSNGDWSFTRDGIKKGIVASGKGLGAVTGDIDLDGDIDIYVANDVTGNLLYVNKGNGTFDEIGTSAGVDLGDQSMPNGSMGTELVDYNQDGLPDIGVANFENEDFALYKQVRLGGDASGSFIFNLASKKARLTAIDQLYVSWGTLFEDFDGDGDDDLIVNNGHIVYYPKTGTVKQKPQVFENRDSVFRFKGVVDSKYFEEGHYGRGMTTADLDRDGDLDLILSNCKEPFAILENTGKQKNQLKRIQLIGTTTNRDGIGAIIRPNAEKWIKIRSGGGSYLTSNETATWVTLKNAKPAEISNFGPVKFTKAGNDLIGVETKSFEE